MAIDELNIKIDTLYKKIDDFKNIIFAEHPEIYGSYYVKYDTYIDTLKIFKQQARHSLNAEEIDILDKTLASYMNMVEEDINEYNDTYHKEEIVSENVEMEEFPSFEELRDRLKNPLPGDDTTPPKNDINFALLDSILSDMTSQKEINFN